MLDFYCPAAKLGIEIDGIAHEMGDRPERDRVRDAWLRAQCIEILRIPAGEVLKSVEQVVEAILAASQKE